VSYGDLLGANVIQLLTDFGEAVTFRRTAKGTYNPATGGTDGAGTDDDESVYVAFVKRKDRLADLIDQASGRTMVERGKRRALMAAKQTDGSALTKTPTTDDQLVGVGDPVTIYEAQTFRVGGSVVAYALEVSD